MTYRSFREEGRCFFCGDPAPCAGSIRRSISWALWRGWVTIFLKAREAWRHIDDPDPSDNVGDYGEPIS